MSYWLGEVWIRIRNISVVLTLFFVSLENRVCLSRDVQVAGAAWRASTRIVAWVGDLVQRIADGRTGQLLGSQAIERSGGIVYGLHRECGNGEHGFLGWASKSRSTVCDWFGLKITRIIFSGLVSKSVATIFSGLASKSMARVSRFVPQNRQLQFGDLDLKFSAMFLIWASKPNRLRVVGYAIKFWWLTSPGSKSR
jgi:hypothetical protein